MKNEKLENITKQASWGGRFEEAPSDLMLRFSQSISFDKDLYSFDIEASKAHATMLKQVGIISEAELNEILHGLDIVLEKIDMGHFKWDIALEDVHMNIEHELTKIAPAAAKLHTARSRNDQVATDMRLYFKAVCKSISSELKVLIGNLLDLAQANQKIYIPGYTHLQRAQPVSVAHHILAWVEMFLRDIKRFDFAYESANICPLGSGAIAGTTLPTDRTIPAEILGFKKGDELSLTNNSMDAVADRDVFMEFTFACATLGIHISRLSEDVILWNSSEFAFVKLPDTFTTGSSLMPQKKNPDAFELLRGKSARLVGNMNTMFTLLKSLPLTYNRDLQEDKPAVFDSYKQTIMCIDVLKACMPKVKFNEDKCAQAVSDPLLLATDLADYFVLIKVPFRKAHHIVGQLVAISENTNTPINELADEIVFELCPQADKTWREVFNLDRAFEKRENIGMPGNKEISRQIKRCRELVRI